MAASNGEEVISLEWVLGCSTGNASLGVHALSHNRIFYISGNVGVIFDTHTHTQTLLRGHDADAFILITACAGPGSSIIFWDTAGRPLTAVDSPHAGGTLALDVSLDGRFLASMGVHTHTHTHSHTHARGAGEEGAEGTGEDTAGHALQDVCIWQLNYGLDVASALGEDTKYGEEDSSSLQVECVAAASVPIADPQHSITFSQAADLPTMPPGGRGAALPPQLLAYELASTGHSSVVFWCLFGELSVPHGTSQAALTASNAAFADARIQWQMVCAAGKLPGAPAAALHAPTAEGRSTTAGEANMGGGASVAAGTAVPYTAAGATGAASTAPSSPLGRTGSRRHARATGTTFVPPVATGTFPVSAVTATEDGSLVLWSLPAGSVAMAAPPSTMTRSVLEAAVKASATHGLASEGTDMQPQAAFALAAIMKSAAKTVKLSRPPNINISAARDAAAMAAAAAAANSAFDPSMRVNTLRLSPCARYLVVGSEDGAVRIYDLHLRLLAWYEEMDAGGVTSVSFVPATGDVRSPTAVADAALLVSGGASAVDIARKRRASTSQVALEATPSAATSEGGGAGFGLADFVVATRRSLIVSMRATSFGSQNIDERRGEVMLEGPDAAVVGLAAYPDSPRLAVAVASGCIQLWHTETKQLLVVRELPAPPSAAALGPDGLPLLHAASHMLHPTSVAIDRAARFLAVGTAEGYICVLNAGDLSDVQSPIPPPRHDARRAATGATSPRATAVRSTPLPHTSVSPIVRIAISEDGLHIAAADEDRHVALYRFVRTRVKQMSAGAKSRLGLDSVGARGRNALRGLTADTASGSGLSKTWQMVDGDESGLEEVVTDNWTFIGRARVHSRAVTAITFSPLLADAPHTASLCGFEGDAWWSATAGDTPQAVIARHQSAGLSALASVGADRRLILYDVGASSVPGGLVMVGDRERAKVEQFATPSCAIWYPIDAPLPDTEVDGTAAASSLLVANSHYKIRLLRHGGEDVRHAGGLAPGVAARRTAMGVATRKTVLGPTFGGAIAHMLPLSMPADAESDVTESTAPGRIHAMAFATDDRVVGLLALPLTGSPIATVGVVGHPGPVTGLAASHDGSHLFSCGLDTTSSAAGSAGNGSVCIWRLRTRSLLDSVEEAGGPSALNPFLSLLEGGAEGKLYQDMCDFFSYAQIRSQGEASTARRRAGITLPLSELASVMRALGFYPTAAEIAGLMNEVKAINAAGGATGAAAEQVDLQTLIRCYVNHRPVVNVGRDDLLRALISVAHHVDPEGTLADPASAEHAPISWGGISQLLSMKGERMHASELRTCLTALMGTTTAGGPPLTDGDDVTPSDVASRVLGFL